MENKGRLIVLEGACDGVGKSTQLALLKKALEIIPKNVVIHRLTGDPPKKILIAPDWTKNKKLVLSRINNLVGDYERL